MKAKELWFGRVFHHLLLALIVLVPNLFAQANGFTPQTDEEGPYALL
jgi:hypothetical protein